MHVDRYMESIILIDLDIFVMDWRFLKEIKLEALKAANKELFFNGSPYLPM